MNVPLMLALSGALRDIDAVRPILNLPEGKSGDKFTYDFSQWAELEPTCKTVGCAVGLASFLPAFNAAGFTSAPVEDADTAYRLKFGLRRPMKFMINGEKVDPITGAAQVLDISVNTAASLFMRTQEPYYGDDPVSVADKILVTVHDYLRELQPAPTQIVTVSIRGEAKYDPKRGDYEELRHFFEDIGYEVTAIGVTTGDKE